MAQALREPQSLAWPGSLLRDPACLTPASASQGRGSLKAKALGLGMVRGEIPRRPSTTGYTKHPAPSSGGLHEQVQILWGSHSLGQD
jgi:hypothetical protein